jgi:ATP-dependent 26S proteasome regulatory subunit
VFNVLEQIASQAVDEDLVKQSIRMTKRAGVPMEKTYLEKFANDLGKTTDSEKRRQEALERKQWEEQRATTTSDVGSNVAENLGGGRSALSRREGNNGKPDMFMNSVLNPDKIATVARDKNDLQKEMNASQQANVEDPTMTAAPTNPAAANRVSELIAKAGAGASFEGESLGIGGLDDVLAQVKRRVWTPLAAPPQLLEELGIHPVRGLLLYGKPGCGKTLLARTLGQILSPMRPVTVVSGPEIMDKFVGSSEKVSRSWPTCLEHVSIQHLGCVWLKLHFRLDHCRISGISSIILRISTTHIGSAKRTGVMVLRRRRYM